MNRHLTQSDDLPLFMPTNNAGEDAGWLYKRLICGIATEDQKQRLWWMRHRFKGAKLIEFKPLASDKQTPHDIQLRVHRNMGSKKEPVEVAGPRWVEKHPAVYTEFKRVALKLIKQGRKHYGAKGIAEYLRLHTDVEGGSEFKIANFAVTYLAVKFVEEFPEHAGFFKIHKRK